MAKVTEIKSKQVDQQTVELLKELLAKAEKGELVSLLFVDSYDTGEVGMGWAGAPDQRMIGALEELKFGFFTEMYFPEGD